MREKGFHGPNEACGQSLSYRVEYSNWETRSHTANCGYKESELHDRRIENPVCIKLHSNSVPWPDLPEPRRQEYLATAKAVLPEIVGEVLQPIQSMVNTQHDDEGLWFRAKTAPEAYLQSKLRELHGIIEKLRDRRLEELK
jgi:hypothetical protein